MSIADRIHNFSAGPGALPEAILIKAQAELLNFQGSGMSVMEMSHRSSHFDGVMKQTESRIRTLMDVPDNYEVLFLQGGASLQFAMIPMNLVVPGKPVDVLVTGAWTKKAVKEMAKIGAYKVVASTEDENFKSIPEMGQNVLSENASYVYLTSNNTIFGTQWQTFPETGQVPLVVDMSSDILSRRIDVSKFGLIFAGAQKNLGPAGVTVVIIRKDLIERAKTDLPAMLQYRTHVDQGSMYNTPPCFAIYMMGLNLEWIETQGGVDEIERRNQEKANLLYNAIEESDLYYCPVAETSRSLMNVVFRVVGDREDVEAALVKEATANGLSGLKGHRSVGGLRASIYNAQPLEAVEALVSFLTEFAHKQPKAVSESLSERA
ncbi:MAG: phosphoserine aminotransferase [Candidatus Marinamargulisbacteria bacterium]|jgi:phosphoserine aminotransferase